MNPIGLLLLALAGPISDTEIRNQTRSIEAQALKSPPAMSVDSLLETAMLVQPYVPEESKRLYNLVLKQARAQPELRLTHTIVKRWTTLDSDEADKHILGLKNRSQALGLLISHYLRTQRIDRAGALAFEAMRTPSLAPADTPVVLQTAAQLNPVKAAEHFAGMSTSLGEPARSLVNGLVEAFPDRPDEVRSAIEKILPVVADPAFGSRDREMISRTLLVNGKEASAKGTRASLLLMMAVMERCLSPDAALREAYQPWSEVLQTLHGCDQTKKILQSGRTRFELAGGSGEPYRPVPPDFTPWQVIPEIQRSVPPRWQLSALWRYLVAKPRPEAEVEDLVGTFLKWSETALPESDPAWHTESLLNLEGRLYSGGEKWILPATLRPAVFHAACKVAERMDRDPERLTVLTEAMRKEKIRPPKEIPSVQARLELLSLRELLEERFDFNLTSLAGPTRSLKAERGKVVLINFWATWCAPCLAELPALEAVYNEFRESGLEIFSVTDEPKDVAARHLEKNPLSFPILLDPQRKVFEHYRVQGIPQTFALNAEGAIAAHLNGPQTEAQLRTAVEAARASQ